MLATPVSLQCDLPRELAIEAEELQQRDPEVLRCIIEYGLTRVAIFEHLSKRYGQEMAERTAAKALTGRLQHL